LSSQSHDGTPTVKQVSPIPPSEPAVQLSLQRALQGLTFLTWDYSQVRILFGFRRDCSHFKLLLSPAAIVSKPRRLVATPGRLTPGALRPVTSFPGFRLLWHLRRHPGFTGGFSPPFQGGLPRSRERTLRGSLGGGYQATHLLFAVPDHRRGTSSLPVEPFLADTVR